VSSRIIEDVENGAIILIHDLEAPPTDGETLPAEALAVAQGFAQKLGIDHTKLGPFQLGYLFDTVDRVIHALSESPGSGQAQAADTEAVAPAPDPGIAQDASGGLNTEAVAPATQPAEQAAVTPPPAESVPPTVTLVPPADTPAVDQDHIDAAINKAQADWGGGTPTT